MADGFGFSLEDAAPVTAEQALKQDDRGFITAGTGAGAPESWWGELVEFAAPLVLCVGFAAAVIAAAPGGFAVLFGGPAA